MLNWFMIQTIVPKESLEIDGPIEHYYELLNVLFEIDDHFRPFLKKDLKNFEIKINRTNLKKGDLEYVDLEQGESRQDVSIMTKEEEEKVLAVGIIGLISFLIILFQVNFNI